MMKVHVETDCDDKILPQIIEDFLIEHPSISLFIYVHRLSHLWDYRVIGVIP